MIQHYTSCFFSFIADHIKVIPYFFGLFVSLYIEPISFLGLIIKMAATIVSLLAAQIVSHYMKPLIIKKIERCKNKKNNKDELHK